MNLRQKLLTTFGGLMTLALVIAGVSMWMSMQWRGTNEQLQGHYQRSLLLQRVRAATFRAIKEVPDAIFTEDDDAREEFEALLKPVEDDFQLWKGLAHNEVERQEVLQVRRAYEALIRDAREVFDLVDSGNRTEAMELAENRLEDEHLARFQQFSEQAVESDRQNRQVVNTKVQGTQQTAQLALAIASFGAISLILLLSAYLASDLFAPLREVEQALDNVAKGDLQRHLSEERADELGAISEAFNRMVDSIAQREQLVGLATVPVGVSASVVSGLNESEWQNIPSRVTLHRLVSQLRSQVMQLNQQELSPVNSKVVEPPKQAVVKQLDSLLQAIARITEFGFPLDLNLARTDIRALIYEALTRFQAELIERGVSIEIQINPEVNYAIVDRLKLREVLSELIRNALNALPEQGGNLGIRSAIVDGGTTLQLEVADNGRGVEQPLINQAFNLDNLQSQHRTKVGLALTKAIVEQHGGHLLVESEPGQGTYIQIQLPLRA